MQNGRYRCGHVSEACGKEHSRNRIVLLALCNHVHAGKRLLGTGGCIEFHRHGHERKERRGSKEDNTHQCEGIAQRTAGTHQHNTDNHEPRAEIATDVCNWDNGGTQPHREVALRMLDSVTHLVRGDTRGTCVTAVVHFFRKVECFVQRIVMVREEPMMHKHLHVGDARIHEDGLRHVGTGEAAGNVHFLARSKTGLDKHGDSTGQGQCHQENHHV